MPTIDTLARWSAFYASLEQWAGDRATELETDAPQDQPTDQEHRAALQRAMDWRD